MLPYQQRHFTLESQQNSVLDRKHRVPEITRKNCLHAHMSTRPRIATHPDPRITLDGRRLEVVFLHKILGVTFDSGLNWKRHITVVRESTIKKLNLLFSKQTMVVLGSLEYSSVAFGSARKEQLQRLDPIPHP
jgi:hypothetical protein